jgi:hypothetical protein
MCRKSIGASQTSPSRDPADRNFVLLHVWVSRSLLESISQLVAWSMRVIDFEELRGLADEVRSFIQMSDDKALALRAVIAGHDVVLGIFPSSEQGVGLHVIKGNELLRQIANSNETGDYTHTAIAVHNREQAVTLQALVA